MSADTNHVLEIRHPRVSNMPTLELIWQLGDPAHVACILVTAFFSFGSAWHPAMLITKRFTKAFNALRIGHNVASLIVQSQSLDPNPLIPKRPTPLGPMSDY